MQSAQFSGLKQFTFSYQGNSSSAHEAVVIDSSGAGVLMSDDWNTANINGTESMQVGTSGAIQAQYVVDSAVTALGSTTVPSYSKPLSLTFLGKPFQIVGSDSGGLLL